MANCVFWRSSVINFKWQDLVDGSSQCRGVHLGYHAPGENKHGYLDFRVGGVSSLRKQNAVMSPTGLEPEDCVGEVQQQTTYPKSRQIGRPTSTNPQLSKNN
jgi:hypothetical protein